MLKKGKYIIESKSQFLNHISISPLFNLGKYLYCLIFKAIGCCFFKVFSTSSISIRPYFVVVLLILWVTDSKGTETNKVKWKILPDSNFTIEQIIDSKDQFFKNQDSIFPSLHQKYWLKILITNSIEQNVYLSAIPNIHNEWFYQSKNGSYESTKTGLQITPDRRDHYFMTSLLHKSDSIYYILMDVVQMNQFRAFIPSIKMHNAQKIDDKEWYITLFSGLSVLILLIYMINISVEFYLLRETTHIYYIIGLIGGLMYVLSYHSVIDLWTNIRVIKVIAASMHQVYFADFSYILNRLSIITICFGVIKLTNAFLDTKNNIPSWHKVLNYYLRIFIFANLISLLTTLFTSFPSEMYFISISNIMLIIAIALVITCGILCLKKDPKNARLFLIAHLLPFIFIISNSIYVELNPYNTLGHVMMPYLSILSVPIGLNTLLTLRVIYVKTTLNENKILTQQIELVNERMTHEKEKEKFEKENIKNLLEVEKLSKENLELKIDLQNRQLLTSALQMQKKDEIIKNISQEVSNISKKPVALSSPSLKAIKSLIENHQTTESYWDSFKEHFENIHPNFFEKLKIEHPELTNNEIRLSAYLKLNLTNKEIAVLQNIEPSSVKRAKIRLKQKLNKGENS